MRKRGFGLWLLGLGLCLTGCSAENPQAGAQPGNSGQEETVAEVSSETEVPAETTEEAETTGEEETVSETETESETPSETVTESSAEGETVRPNSDGLDLYPAGEKDENLLLPYAQFAFLSWKVSDSETGQEAREENGVWYQHAPCAYVTRREMIFYKEMSEESDSFTVPEGTVLAAEATDRQNWIYFEDPEGVYSGWLHILKEEGINYRVEVGEEIYQLDSMLTYDADGSDYSDPQGAQILQNTALYEEELKEKDLVVKLFNSQEELTTYLQENQEAMDTALYEDLEKYAQDWKPDSWMDDEMQVELYLYRAYTNLSYTRFIPDIVGEERAFKRLLVYAVHDYKQEKQEAVYYQIGTMGPEEEWLDLSKTDTVFSAYDAKTIY